MGNDLLEQINLKIIGDLINLAFKAEKKFGNNGFWVSNYSRAMDGLEARIFGLKEHYKHIQSNVVVSHLSRQDIIERDYHLSSIFFNMDSAIECLSYGLNAIGFGIGINDFISITDNDQLKKIMPENIFKKDNISQYKTLFPTLTEYWRETSRFKRYVTPLILWESIKEQHDVSKHRFRIYQGCFGSRNEIDYHLERNPKTPLTNQNKGDYDYYQWTLVDHLKEFIRFINKSCKLIYDDLSKFIESQK